MSAAGYKDLDVFRDLLLRLLPSGERPTIGQLALRRAPMFYVRLWRKKFRETYRLAMHFVRYPSEAIRSVDFIVEELHRRSGLVAEREAKSAECKYECKCECQRELQPADF